MLLVDAVTATIIGANAAAAEHLEYRRKELLQLSTKELLPIDAPPAGNGEGVPGPFPNGPARARTGSGELVDVAVTTFPISGVDRTMWVLQLDDVTPAILLRAHEREWQFVLGSSPVGVLSLDATGRILQTNQTLQNLFGYQESELSSMNIMDLTHPDDLAMSRVQFARFLDGSTDHARFEKRFICKDGSPVWTEATVAVVRDENGRFRHTISVVVEITLRKRAEQRLQESEQRLREAQRIGKLGSIDWGLANGEPVLTEEALRIFAFDRDVHPTADEVNGRIHPADRERVVHARGTIAESQRRVETEYRLLLPDGAVVFVRSTTEILSWDDHHSTRLFETVLDMTEMHASRAAERESELKFRRAFMTSPDAISLSRLADGIFIEVNEGYITCFGFPESEVVGHSAFDLNVWVDTADRTRIAKRLLSGQTVRDYELLLRRKDGSLFSALLSASRLELSEVDYILISVRDISNRKRDQEERHRLLTAIEQTGEMVMVTDSRWCIQYVNPAFEQVSGLTRNVVMGHTPYEIVDKSHQDEILRHRHQIRETVATGRNWKGSFVNERPDGKTYILEASISPVLDSDGKIIDFVIVARDITVQQDLEDQLRQAQKMETIGRLAGGVAHDFNNMLQVITNYTDLSLAATDNLQPVQGYLQEVRRAADRSAAITHQLLAFARKQPIHPKQLNLNETIDQANKMTKRLIGENIDFRWTPGSDLWTVRIDPAQVDQIVANLAINARDAISGIGSLSISTQNILLDEAFCARHPDSIPGPYVLLTVNDDGPGMDEETLSHLFEPFFTTKQPGQGTGLGLSTVYGIVSQNGGFVTVSSQRGEGTTFRIYLPRTSEEPLLGEGARLPDSARRGAETILVVEDQPEILALTQIQLDSLGYHVLTAHTPIEALRLAEAEQGPIDIMITDIMMPKMTGHQLATFMKEQHPHLRILFMSGYAAEEAVYQESLDGLTTFLAKPFTLDALSQKIRQLLDDADPPIDLDT